MVGPVFTSSVVFSSLCPISLFVKWALSVFLHKKVPELIKIQSLQLFLVHSNCSVNICSYFTTMTPTITITTPTLNKSIATSRCVCEGVKQGKTQSQRVESLNVGTAQDSWQIMSRVIMNYES